MKSKADIARSLPDDSQRFDIESRQVHEHIRQLIGHLGKGEASCIAYACERKATVVTDDRTARKQCSQMNIPVTGTIGILKASVLDQHLNMEQAHGRFFCRAWQATIAPFEGLRRGTSIEQGSRATGQRG